MSPALLGSPDCSWGQSDEPAPSRPGRAKPRTRPVSGADSRLSVRPAPASTRARVRNPQRVWTMALRPSRVALLSVAAACLCLGGCTDKCADVTCPRLLAAFSVYDSSTRAPLDGATVGGLQCVSNACSYDCCNAPFPSCPVPSIYCCACAGSTETCCAGTTATVGAIGYRSEEVTFDSPASDPSCCSAGAGTTLLLRPCANHAATCQCSSANGGLCEVDADCCNGTCSSNRICHGV
jgi:hypothetical protein